MTEELLWVEVLALHIQRDGEDYYRGEVRRMPRGKAVLWDREGIVRLCTWNPAERPTWPRAEPPEMKSKRPPISLSIDDSEITTQSEM